MLSFCPARTRSLNWVMYKEEKAFPHSYRYKKVQDLMGILVCMMDCSRTNTVKIKKNLLKFIEFMSTLGALLFILSLQSTRYSVFKTILFKSYNSFAVSH